MVKRMSQMIDKNVLNKGWNDCLDYLTNDLSNGFLYDLSLREHENFPEKELKNWFKNQKRETTIKDTKIISAFPACGKTYAVEELNKRGLIALDSDSSNFSWMERKRTEEELEKAAEIWSSVPRKMSKTWYMTAIEDDLIKVRNPEFPKNYIEHIKENIGKVDYIFVSSHKEVREALLEAEIPFTLIVPARDMKAEWIGRCWLRGSGEDFCKMLNINWDKWMDEIIEDGRLNVKYLTYANTYILTLIDYKKI